MKTRMMLLCALALAGCVPSWNPFYTEKDVVFDNALVATWRPAKAREGTQESWAFTNRGDKLYQLTQTDEAGRRALFEARLFALKEHRFLDLYLSEIEGEGQRVNDWASASLVPAHLLLKVEQVEPTLKLAAMNPDWMQTFLKRSPEALAHRLLSGDQVVLTANTAELQKFILEHAGDEEFFGGAFELQRK